MRPSRDLAFARSRALWLPPPGLRLMEGPSAFDRPLQPHVVTLLRTELIQPLETCALLSGFQQHGVWENSKLPLRDIPRVILAVPAAGLKSEDPHIHTR